MRSNIGMIGEHTKQSKERIRSDDLDIQETARSENRKLKSAADQETETENKTQC